MRIVCLTEETVEILWRLGAWDLVVGVSGYAVRPQAARQKPRVSSFLDARFDAIVALEPDLVLGFSDLQADIARELIRRGIAVCVLNQRSVEEILRAVRQVGALVGKPREAEALVQELARGVEDMRAAAARLPRRPRVFCEEWPDPLIAGICWVSELVEVAGGEDVFPELRRAKLGKERVVAPEEVARRDPEVVIASWCGRKARLERIAARPAFARTAAVRAGHLYEVKSTYILQPGPAALTDGLAQLHAILAGVARGESPERVRAQQAAIIPWEKRT